jgi:hypothetical protein
MPYSKRQLTLSSGYVTLEYSGNLFELNARDRLLVSSLTDLLTHYEREIAGATQAETGPQESGVSLKPYAPKKAPLLASPPDSIATEKADA